MRDRLLYGWIANVVALFVAVVLVGNLEVDGALALIGAGAVFGVLNALVKPVLKLLALPLVLVTLGLALLVLNILLFWALVAIVPGLEADGLRSIVAGGVIATIANLITHAVTDRRRERRDEHAGRR